MPSGIVIVADTKVELDVSPERNGSGKASEVILSSGKVITILILSNDSVDRKARVTFTSQSAVSLGEIEGFCPTFDISIDFSSTKTDGLKVIDETDDEVLVESLLPKVTKYAGLKMPLGTNAGPYLTIKYFPLCSYLSYLPSPSRSPTESYEDIA